MATKDELLEELRRIFPNKMLLTADDVAQLLGMHRQSIYNMLSDDTFPIPVRRVGKKVYVNIVDLAEYLVTNQVIKKASKDDKREKLRQQAIYLFKNELDFLVSKQLAQEERNLFRQDRVTKN